MDEILRQVENAALEKEQTMEENEEEMDTNEEQDSLNISSAPILSVSSRSHATLILSSLATKHSHLVFFL